MNKKIDFRIEKTYLSLNHAFTSLLEEKRFADFTVNELCDRAMIRRTTFYKHFADKYEYFSWYIKETCSSFKEQLSFNEVSCSMHDYFWNMCAQLLDFLDENEKLVLNVKENSMLPVLMDDLMEQISTSVSNAMEQMEETRKMIPLQITSLANFYAGGLVNTLRQKLKQGNQISIDELMDVISICFATVK